MKRSKSRDLGNSYLHFGDNEGRFLVFRAAMDDSMSHSALISAGDAMAACLPCHSVLNRCSTASAKIVEDLLGSVPQFAAFDTAGRNLDLMFLRPPPEVFT